MQELVTQQTLPLSQTNATAISDEVAARATAIQMKLTQEPLVT
jgi:hypothetical protein